MDGATAEAIAVAALVAVVAAAVAGSRRVPEVAVAVPAGGLLIALGVLSPDDAATEIGRLGPTVGFLAAVLLLAHLAGEEGVFTAAGRFMASRCGGRPRTLLGLVFAVAAVVTALLSLDATVVLLTPVVFATAASLRLRPRPHVYACTHLANSASLLLPVSNLTNLLGAERSGLPFARFGALMALPWLVVIAVEYVAMRRFFRSDLAAPAATATPPAVDPPVFALVVLALTLLGFGFAATVHIGPVWVATAGAAVLAVRRLARRRISPWRLLVETNPPFCVFVLALGVVVAGVAAHGLGHLVHRMVPDDPTLAGLLLTAVIAAVLANLLNNLPAVLLLLPVLRGPGLVLAALIGVNVGPNLTYVGSLATLLWRRVLRARDAEPALGDFLRLGLLTVPAGLVGATVALWLGLRTIGG